MREVGVFAGLLRAVLVSGDRFDEDPLRLGELRLKIRLALGDRVQHARTGQQRLHLELRPDQYLVTLLLQRDQIANLQHMPVTLEKTANRAPRPG